jgi:hypothetical protein
MHASPGNRKKAELIDMLVEYSKNRDDWGSVLPEYHQS